jgi:hypothetical protein
MIDNGLRQVHFTVRQINPMKTRSVFAPLVAAVTLVTAGFAAPSDPSAAAPALKAEFVDPDSADPEIASVRKTGEDAINRLGYMMVQEITAAVKKSGAEAAIDVAHLKKLPMANGRISGLPNITAFKRTSLKLRDRANSPDPAEKLALQKFLEELTTGTRPPEVLVQRIAKPNAAPEWRVYRPFGTLPICLNCHGDLNEQSSELRAKLDQLYPVDQAFGYAAGEWRGVLSVAVDLTPPPESPKPAGPPASTNIAPKKKS